MGSIGDQLEGRDAEAVRCPVCGSGNLPMRYCRHVRWTFDQGGPLEFARFALETSPYLNARGLGARDIANAWWAEHEEFVVDQILLRFDANDGYVFGDIADLDLLVRDIWRAFRPEPERPALVRY